MSTEAFCEPVWAEGMFLLPQHLQLFARHQARMRWAIASALSPQPWGITRLEIDREALAAGNLRLERLEAVMPDGLVLSLPGNLSLAARSLPEQLSDAGGGTLVHLGVPELRPDQPNLLEGSEEADQERTRRFQAEQREVYDLNTGGSPRALAVYRLRGRLLVGDEERQGYQCLPLLRLQRAAGGGLRPDPEYLPPLLRLDAWEGMHKLARAMATRLALTRQALAEEAAGKALGEILDATHGNELALKLLSLAPVAGVEQLVALGGCHPLMLYLELVKLAGALQVLTGQGDGQPLPSYDPLDLGGCFHGLWRRLEAMLEGLAAPSYRRRAFLSRHQHLEVDLEPEWASGRLQLYLGVDGVEDPEAVIRQAASWKLCAPRDLEEVVQRRLGGLALEWLRRPPAALPARGHGLYARIATGGPLWAGVQEDLTLVLSGAGSLPYRFELFVL